MVRVFSLEAEYGSPPHFCIDVAVFAIILPYAWPAGIASQVDGGRISPRAAAGFGFIGSNTCGFTGQVAVEGSSHIDVLRKERSTHCVGCPVILVQSIDAGYADFSHGLFSLQGSFFSVGLPLSALFFCLVEWLGQLLAAPLLAGETCLPTRKILFYSW